MKELHCSDYGNATCPAVFKGETVEDVLEQAKRHGQEAHGQSDEQVNSPEVRRIAEEKSRDVA